MAIKPLSPLQAKLLRLALDSGAADGESLTAISKLRQSLLAEGPNPHELIDALQNAGFASPEEAPLPPVPTKPDYGLCKIPFDSPRPNGPKKGDLFMDTSPYDLRRLREWCKKTPELAAKFASIIHDIESFLGPGNF
jgi:hypothetical protein